MKASFRSGLILTGTILLYSAFLLQSRNALPFADSIIHWPTVILLLLIASLLLYGAGGLMSRGHGVIAASNAALILFLLNPLVTDPALLVSPLEILKESLGAVALAAAWLWTEHWSTLMRSLVLSVLLAIGLTLGAHSTQLIVLSLVIWMFFSRRPLTAVMAFILILVVGGLLHQAVLMAYGFVWKHDGNWVAIWQTAVERHQVFWDFRQWFGAGVPMSLVIDRVDRYLLELSAAWWILALWMAGERMKTMIRERRSGAESFLASVVILGTAAGLFSEGVMRSELSGLLLISCAAAPLLAVDLTQRELLMSRAARITAVGAFFFGAIAALTSRGWAGLAAIGAAYVFSRLVVRAPWVVPRVRWLAILAGASVGAWLATSFSLFRS